MVIMEYLSYNFLDIVTESKPKLKFSTFRANFNIGSSQIRMRVDYSVE